MFKKHDFSQNGVRTTGHITEVKRCWWFKVNTKGFRTHCLDGARFPHWAYYTYTAEGKKYKGKTTFKFFERPPEKGETLTVFYDPQNPQLHSVKK